MEFDIVDSALADKINYICKRTFGMLKIPVYFIDREDNLLFKFSKEDFQNPVCPNQYQSIIENINKTSSDSPINLVSSKYLENYIYIKLWIEENYIGIILVGPSTEIRIGDDALDKLILDLGLQVKYKQQLKHYYENMTVISQGSLTDAMLLLYFSLTGKYIEAIEVIENSDLEMNSSTRSGIDFDTYASSRLQYSKLHHSQGWEQEFLQYITDGNVEDLKVFLNKPFVGTPGVHSKNPLRNRKNLFISTVPKVSYAAVFGGLDWELALSLSDYYIQKVEELTDEVAVRKLLYEMYFDYTNRVKNNKALSQSKVIIKCKNYISSHIYEKITLRNLARELNMNQSYISHAFKEATGMVITDYIKMEKIAEAKRLMLSQHNTITDTYEALGFNDQSHFTRIFKKHTGMTPREYISLRKKSEQ